ncbi:MAG: hypothetical protein GY810_05440 [Aureispira sp.]|nr:hypothetical protein [Aureispira sp.]
MKPLYFIVLFIAFHTGIQAQASLVADIETYPLGSYPTGFTIYNNELYFSAKTELLGGELWKYDGTTEQLVKDINMGSDPSYPGYFFNYKGDLYFSADDGTNGQELWKHDGTSTYLVADINPNGSSNPEGFIIYNDTLYFSADDGTNGRELWKYDGTAASLAADINPTGSSLLASAGLYGANSIIIYNNTLYFSADDGINGQELWMYDGINTTLVADINPNGNSSPSNYIVYKDSLYFVAEDSIHGKEFWKYNGSQATLVADILPGHYHSYLDNFIIYKNNLYFTASDGIIFTGPHHGKELWKYNGDSISIVADINLGMPSSNPKNLTIFNDTLFFTADDGINGPSFFKYDGDSLI